MDLVGLLIIFLVGLSALLTLWKFLCVVFSCEFWVGLVIITTYYFLLDSISLHMKGLTLVENPDRDYLIIPAILIFIPILFLIRETRVPFHALFLLLTLGFIAYKASVAVSASNNESRDVFVSPHDVSGYEREDGTYVPPYFRDGDGNTSINRTLEQGGGYYRKK